MTTFFSAIRRTITLTATALVIAGLAVTFGGCGGDDKTAAPGGATAVAGGGPSSNGGSGEKSRGGGSDESTSGSGGSDGSGGSGDSGDSDSGSSKDGSSNDSDGDSKPRKRQRSGPVIKDDNSFDRTTSEPSTGKALSGNQRRGLGSVLGVVKGAADEYVAEAFKAGWFRTDSRKIRSAMNEAELSAPFIQEKLILASGAFGSGQAGTLRTDLIGAFASFEALKRLEKETAGRRVARALGTLEAALDTARRAGVKIDRSVPSRSDLKDAR